MTTCSASFGLTRVLLIFGSMAGLLLGGCSSLEGTYGGKPTPQRPSVSATQGAIRSLPVPSPNEPALLGVPSLKALPEDAGAVANGEATGPLRDPLEPNRPIDLNDEAAKQDLWARVRGGFAMPDLEGPLVQNHEQWYASRPEYVSRMTDRASRYLFHIVEEVQRRGLPSELALLPFIESAFNPKALSSAKASGIWQFIPSTGKHFDLKQNVFRDDRRDVLASTEAALDYLQKLHAMFGDWHLALAAYNWGEGNVQRAQRRNERAGRPTDYSSLSMPAETRHYLPKLQAVKNIVLRPERYGLKLAPIENHPYFVAVPIRRDIDVKLAARLAELSESDFHELNPSYNKPVILAAGTPQVLLPYENAERFVANLQTHLQTHAGPLASWTAWTVPRTMHPGEAARQIGMDEAELRAINRIPPRMIVKAGSTLLVPRQSHRELDVSEQVADNAAMLLAPDRPPLQRKYIRAGKRDTVASLAKRHRISAGQLAAWNKLPATARLNRGQKLAIYVADAPARSAKAVPKHRLKAAATKSVRKTASRREGTRVGQKTIASKRKVAVTASSSKPKATRHTRASNRVASANQRVGAR